MLSQALLENYYLEFGFVSKKTVLIDAGVAGLSGDMFLSALLDLIGDDGAIVPVAASLLIYDPAVRVRVVTTSIESTSGKRLEITKDSGVRFLPESLNEILGVVCEELELSKQSSELARKALDVIIQAESKVHNTPVDQLHLHETGSVDTILDLVGAMYLLEKAGLLGQAKFLATEVAVGNGTVKTEHGELQVPVPAVAEILSKYKIPHNSGKAQTEVLTPTGAALLAVLVDEYIQDSNVFMSDKQGVGMGTRDLGTVPNMVKVSTGVLEVPEGTPKKEELTLPPKEEKPKKTPVKPKVIEERIEVFDDWNTDEVIVIEANVDDVDGEVMGDLFDVLLSEGLAYDVVMIPAYGKKNRPCFIVKVIAAKAGFKSVAEIMIRHLGTLGIRYTEWNRLKAARETIVCMLDIDNKEFMVRVKVSRGSDGSIVNIKPEADDVIRVSKETGIPIRELKPRIVLQAHAVTE
jgi:uncharacterized protein (TIGR00299 family) protein